MISQAVSRHFGGPVESGICFGIPRHHLKRNGRVVGNPAMKEGRVRPPWDPK